MNTKDCSVFKNAKISTENCDTPTDQPKRLIKYKNLFDNGFHETLIPV